jgi:hypothetical protein
MKKFIQGFILIIIFSLSILIFGCNRKPAYSDVKVENPARAGEPSPTAEKPADPVAEVDRKAESTNQQPTAPNSPQPAEQKPFVIPAFFDSTKGAIKDIPRYPDSSITNMQYGPLGEATVVFMVMQSKGPVEKIGAFYDKELKRNGWKILSNTRDPILYEWTLKKDDANEGTVKVTKEETSGTIYIALTRSEKKVEPKQ